MIQVSTTQVLEIAKTIDDLNKRLQEALENSNQVIRDLSKSWEGEAATATIEAADKFAQKYIQNYHDIIDSYVKFLRTNVGEGYEETENTNVNLADAFN